MLVTCATDGYYLRHCVAMLQSLWQHNPNPDLEVFIIFDNVESQQLSVAVSYLHDLLPSVSLLQASAKPLSGFPVSGHASIATYFRLLLPGLLPESVERVLFIDSDTIILSDLLGLWNRQLQGKALGAVPEHRLSCLDHGYVFGEYFNAGIMLIDLVKWRQSNLIERGKLFAKNHPDRLRHWDQDVLNHVFEGDWLAVEDRWNACPHLFGLNGGYDLSEKSLSESERQAISDPAVVHFAGPGAIKPWNARCQHPLKDLYLHAKAQTPWAKMALDDAQPPAWQQAINDAMFRSKCYLRRYIPNFKAERR